MKATSAIFAGLCVALAAPAAAQSLAPPGAAACSGCHAPARLGSPVVAIDGRPAPEIVQAMQEFRSGQRPATVMDRIAKGFSDDETRAIAAWLAAQR
jgi:sulfide dehydrogenase cytochrome subunit